MIVHAAKFYDGEMNSPNAESNMAPVKKSWHQKIVKDIIQSQ